MRQYFPGNGPTVTGAAETKEMSFYNSRLRELREWLGPAHLKFVGAFLIDEEKWSAGVGSTAFVKAATRKADLIYSATMSVFPGVCYEMYGRGAVTRSDRYNHFTLDRAGGNQTVVVYIQQQ